MGNIPQIRNYAPNMIQKRKITGPTKWEKCSLT